MHGGLSPVQNSETPNENKTPERDPDHKSWADYWPVLMLVVGGVLTLAWTGFLLWAAIQAVSWLAS